MAPVGGAARGFGYVLVGGVLVEPLSEHWAVFSPISGETHLINDTSAAVLESVSCETTSTLAQLSASLAADAGIEAGDALPLVRQALEGLVTAGLVREVPLPRAPAT